MEAKLQALKVPELKALLQKASLPVTGKKEDLVKRLLETPTALADLEGEAASQPGDAGPAPSAPAVAAAATSDGNATPAKSPTAPSEAEQREILIAELEKRKARAARFGQPLGEAEAKLERAIKFGLTATEDQGMKKLDGELKQGRGAREPKAAKAAPPTTAKAEESEEAKAARIAREEADEAAKKRRAERFGLGPDPTEEEKKRKREEKFGAEAQKKAKEA